MSVINIMVASNIHHGLNSFNDCCQLCQDPGLAHGLLQTDKRPQTSRGLSTDGLKADLESRAPCGSKWR